MELQIKKIMVSKGITLKELAEKMGKTTATLSTQISPQEGKFPSIPALERIAEALDVQVADFFPVPANYIRWDQVLDGKQDDVMFCPRCGTKFAVLPKTAEQ